MLLYVTLLGRVILPRLVSPGHSRRSQVERWTRLVGAFLGALGRPGRRRIRSWQRAAAEAAAIPAPKTAGATETTTICPFCGVAAWQVVSVKEAGW
jgi:hypothetical protein